MSKYIVYLLVAALITPLSFAQQNKSTPEQEIELLKKQVSELQNKLQTVENVEKMELAAKLTEAQAKLANAEFGKFERELRDSNSRWLRNWIAVFGVIFAVFGVALWFVVKSLIADRVEKSLNGFRDAIEQVDILEDQLEILEKEHAVSILDSFQSFVLADLERHPERIKALPEEVLLKVFDDKTRDMEIRWTAIEVLAARKSPQLVSPVLNYLNSVIDLDIDWGTSYQSNRYHYLFLSRLSAIHNEETYQGLKNFLNRLIEENPKNKDTFLPWTIFSLTHVSLQLNNKDSVDILRKVIPDLEECQESEVGIKSLVKYFNKFKVPEGIKELLEHHETTMNSEEKETCLNLLEKYDPDFVKEQRAAETTTNTENEDSS